MLRKDAQGDLNIKVRTPEMVCVAVSGVFVLKEITLQYSFPLNGYKKIFLRSSTIEVSVK